MTRRRTTAATRQRAGSAPCGSWPGFLFALDHGRGRPGELACLDRAALHHGEEPRAILQDGDVAEHVAVDDQEIGKFAYLECAELVGAAQDLRAGFGGAGDDFQRGEADVLDEERQLAGVVTVRVPTEAVVAAHAEPAPGPQDAPGAVGAALQRLLMPVDDAPRQAELLAAFDAGLLEVERWHARPVARHQPLHPLLVHERAI